MNHDEATQLLRPYRDGELDLNTCLRLEEHLAGCASCKQRYEAEQELVASIQSELPRFTASPFLKTRVQTALREELSSPAAMPWWKHFQSQWTYATLAVAAILFAVLAFGSFWSDTMPIVAQEAVGNHVRSLQVSHLVDVVSTDRHTVKPWFAGKLDYSPPVIDLAAFGYPLVGGRLDVLNHRDVAAIVYQRRRHYINLFVWPSDQQPLHGRLYSENGYHAMGWTRSGMNYFAVSELEEKELRDFAEMIKARTADMHPAQ